MYKLHNVSLLVSLAHRTNPWHNQRPSILWVAWCLGTTRNEILTTSFVSRIAISHDRPRPIGQEPISCFE